MRGRESNWEARETGERYSDDGQRHFPTRGGGGAGRFDQGRGGPGRGSSRAASLAAAGRAGSGGSRSVDHGRGDHHYRGGGGDPRGFGGRGRRADEPPFRGGQRSAGGSQRGGGPPSHGGSRGETTATRGGRGLYAMMDGRGRIDHRGGSGRRNESAMHRDQQVYSSDSTSSMNGPLTADRRLTATVQDANDDRLYHHTTHSNNSNNSIIHETTPREAGPVQMTAQRPRAPSNGSEGEILSDSDELTTPLDDHEDVPPPPPPDTVRIVDQQRWNASERPTGGGYDADRRRDDDEERRPPEFFHQQNDRPPVHDYAGLSNARPPTDRFTQLEHRVIESYPTDRQVDSHHERFQNDLRPGLDQSNDPRSDDLNDWRVDQNYDQRNDMDRRMHQSRIDEQRPEMDQRMHYYPHDRRPDHSDDRQPEMDGGMDHPDDRLPQMDRQIGHPNDRRQDHLHFPNDHQSGNTSFEAPSRPRWFDGKRPLTPPQNDDHGRVQDVGLQRSDLEVHRDQQLPPHRPTSPREPRAPRGGFNNRAMHDARGRGRGGRLDQRLGINFDERSRSQESFVSLDTQERQGSSGVGRGFVGRGRGFDGRGRNVDGQGRTFDGRGRTLDGRGRSFDGRGRSFEGGRGFEARGGRGFERRDNERGPGPAGFEGGARGLEGRGRGLDGRGRGFEGRGRGFDLRDSVFEGPGRYFEPGRGTEGRGRAFERGGRGFGGRDGGFAGRDRVQEVRGREFNQPREHYEPDGHQEYHGGTFAGSAFDGGGPLERDGRAFGVGRSTGRDFDTRPEGYIESRYGNNPHRNEGNESSWSVNQQYSPPGRTTHHDESRIEAPEQRPLAAPVSPQTTSRSFASLAVASEVLQTKANFGDPKPVPIDTTSATSWQPSLSSSNYVELLVAPAITSPNEAKSPPPPPPSSVRPPTPPPEPIAPSPYVLALTRLAQMEAQMEFEYAKLTRLSMKRKLVRAGQETIASLPIGRDAFQDELDKYLARHGFTSNEEEKAVQERTT